MVLPIPEYQIETISMENRVRTSEAGNSLRNKANTQPPQVVSVAVLLVSITYWVALSIVASSSSSRRGSGDRLSSRRSGISRRIRSKYYVIRSISILIIGKS